MAKTKSEPRHFFKVFFPEQSSTTLRIPPAFREHIQAESGKRVSLKGPSGSNWKVGLVKISNEFFFDDGWREFVADHSLVMGDFLIFRYRGNSKFKVMVFDTSACEKKTALLARPSGDQSEESREEVSVVEEDEDEENKPLVLFAKKIFEKNLRRKRGINEISGISDILKKKKKKKQFQSEVDGSDSKRSKSSSTSKQGHLASNSTDLIIPKQEIEESEPYLSSSYSQSFRYASMEQNEMSMQRDCALTFRCTHVNKMTRLHQSGQDSSSSPHSIEKKSSSKNNEKALELVMSDENASPKRSIYRVGSLISQRRPVTEEEVKITLERAAAFKSDRPFAIAVMQDSYVYTSFFMCIPTWFAREHLPRENTKMTVRDPTGKPWSITYICYTNHGALSGGWGRFSHANNLEKYDVCVFELIQKNELQVHIYRVVEEIAPLVRRRVCHNRSLRSSPLMCSSGSIISNKMTPKYQDQCLG